VYIFLFVFEHYFGGSFSLKSVYSATCKLRQCKNECEDWSSERDAFTKKKR